MAGRHTHRTPMWCTKWNCDGYPDMHIPMGPVTGLLAVAAELLRHLGYEPAEHPDLFDEVDRAIGDEMLDIGRQILADHGLPVLDSVL